MPTAEVNDLSIYYELHGHGAPLVLILGLRADISQYESLIAWLGARYKLLTFDNRGAGRSEKPDEPYSIEAMADDTVALMLKLSIDRADVLGISMGGRIALALALDHPDRVKRLVLVCTSATRHKRARRSWLPYLLHPVQLVRRLHRTYPQPRYAAKRQRQATRGFEVSERLGEIHRPTLILHGKADATVPYVYAEALHRGIEGSTLIPFEGGHGFYATQERQRFLDTIAKFLEQD
jgi:pimeloyl-ACP methyl ester carboxylesterase